MRINEIILEGYSDDLIVSVQDLLSRLMARGVKSIPTEKFRSLLAKGPGFVVSTDDLIAAVDQSGYASSVDANEIIPATELGSDVDTSAEVTTDVGALATDQAMTDIGTELPQ